MAVERVRAHAETVGQRTHCHRFEPTLGEQLAGDGEHAGMGETGALSGLAGGWHGDNCTASSYAVRRTAQDEGARGMTQIALFHSVLGVRAGVHDAAERLRAAGHDVRVVDQYGGRVFDDYRQAGAYAES